MRKNIILMAVLMITALAYGQQEDQQRRGPQRVPAAPYPIAKVQPDKNDTVFIRLIGDEHWHCIVSIDGWILAENSKGVLCYAKEVGERQYKATRRRAHNDGNRSKYEIKWLNKHGIKFP